MQVLRWILAGGLLLVSSFPAHAGTAFLWKNLRYHTSHDGYAMPERVLREGTLVKVVAIHGKKADIITPSGDPVTVKLEDLHIVADAPPAGPNATQSPAPAAQPPATPSPSPIPRGGGAEKSAASATPSANETAARSVPVRCSHMTKKGEQCTRMTTSPNGLCWQHGGN